MYKDNISVTVTDLKLQDSGTFSIVAEGKYEQYKTKFIVLHVHDLIKDVQIESSVTLLQSTCMFRLRCVASDPRSSYSWSAPHDQTQGSELNITLGRAENITLTCTANNTFSAKNTTETVVCFREKSDEQRFCVKS